MTRTHWSLPPGQHPSSSDPSFPITLYSPSYTTNSIISIAYAIRYSGRRGNYLDVVGWSLVQQKTQIATNLYQQGTIDYYIQYSIVWKGEVGCICPCHGIPRDPGVTALPGIQPSHQTHRVMGSNTRLGSWGYSLPLIVVYCDSILVYICNNAGVEWYTTPQSLIQTNRHTTL